MTPERWRAAEVFFHLATDLPPGGREAFLAQRCPDDPELRGAVEQLLASQPAFTGKPSRLPSVPLRPSGRARTGFR